jgi:hypothetical protein
MWHAVFEKRYETTIRPEERDTVGSYEDEALQ